MEQLERRELVEGIQGCALELVDGLHGEADIGFVGRSVPFPGILDRAAVGFEEGFPFRNAVCWRPRAQVRNLLQLLSLLIEDTIYRYIEGAAYTPVVVEQEHLVLLLSRTARRLKHGGQMRSRETPLEIAICVAEGQPQQQGLPDLGRRLGLGDWRRGLGLYVRVLSQNGGCP